ncbi:MAG: hypothetical protein HN704_17080 [Bacteroidetes bacterium]|nr:hypothetical protein [Bacteroidota bacterium]MBT6686870.1 hypothetical protein [Bacteroidota bacterium]MBT7145128.1 hypothetical protein [Bacteroidota bacterium]MBT7493315.1 hypothetical protein [Bacteroidota bacterium]
MRFSSTANINELDISNISFSKIIFDDCYINKIYGIKKESEIPEYIRNSIIEHYEPTPMILKDKNIIIGQSHMVLCSLLKKIYFLEYDKRTGEELIITFGSKNDKILAKKIINILVKNKLVYKSNDTISSKSFHKDRVIKILDKLDKSNDDIWKDVANIK